MLRPVNESPSISRTIRKTPKPFGGGMRLFTSLWSLDLAQPISLKKPTYNPY